MHRSDNAIIRHFYAPQREAYSFRTVCQSAFFLSSPYLYYPWMDFQITWQKCLAYQDDVSRERTTPLSQRLRSHRQFKCKNVTIRVRSVILLCMDGFSNNLAQMFSISRRYVVRKNYALISKVKVTLVTLAV